MSKIEMSSFSSISKLRAVVVVVVDCVLTFNFKFVSVVVCSFGSGFGFQKDVFSRISFMHAVFIESNEAERKTVEPDSYIIQTKFEFYSMIIV